MYDDIGPGYGLARMHFASTEGTDHAYMIFGLANLSGHSADDLATQVGSSWVGSGCNAMISSLASFSDVTTVTNIGGVLSEGADSFDAVGTGGAAIAPPQVAVVIRKVSGLVGRSNRGRFYMPYFNPGALGTGTNQITDATLAGWQTLWTGFYNALATLFIPPVIIHKIDDKHPTYQTPTEVVALQVVQTIGTQRRRNIRAPHH